MPPKKRETEYSSLFYVPGDDDKREPDMDWMGRMGSIMLHGHLSLSGSRLSSSPGTDLKIFGVPEDGLDLSPYGLFLFSKWGCIMEPGP